MSHFYAAKCGSYMLIIDNPFTIDKKYSVVVFTFFALFTFCFTTFVPEEKKHHAHAMC